MTEEKAKAYATCGGKTRAGSACTRPAGWGTPHAGTGRCKLHGGSTPSHVKAASVAIARQEVAERGLRIDISPQEALLDELARSYGWVVYLEGKVGELKEHDLVWGKTRHKVGGEDRGSTHEAKPSLWYQLLASERRHYLSVSVACTRAEIEAHEMRLAENQGRMVAGAIQRSFAAMLDALLEVLVEMFGDDARSAVESVWSSKVREIVPRELRAIVSSAAAPEVMAS